MTPRDFDGTKTRFCKRLGVAAQGIDGGAPRADLLKLRGTWLGLRAPTARDQQTWRLDAGDELLLGTDGMFDQFGGHQLGNAVGEAGAACKSKVPMAPSAGSRSLCEASLDR